MFFFGFAANLFTLSFFGIISMIFLYQGFHGAIANQETFKSENKIIEIEPAQINIETTPNLFDLEVMVLCSSYTKEEPLPPSYFCYVPIQQQKLPLARIKATINRGPPVA